MKDMHQTKKRYEWILDSLATGVFTVDKDFSITYFNSQAEKLTGYSKQEAIGKKCWEIFRTNQCPNCCNLQKAMATKSKIVSIRVNMIDRRDREIPVAITAAVLHDEKGNMLGGVESFQDDRARYTLEKEARGLYTIDDFITVDDAVLDQLGHLPVFAKSAKPVLILGETGVGKDILARIIHNVSDRKQGPYVKVNCAAIPATMLESELLGHKKGAFTDAKNDKPGKFQLAQNGTILLDEIGELPFDMQAKLLHVIEDKEYYPLGATTMEWVNARIIASTNSNLEKMISENKFRKDLYYRLKMCEFRIPPLRERPNDIELLIDYFISRVATINSRKRPKLSPKARNLLLNYHYSGNVRELKSIIEYAFMICNDRITLSDLPQYLLKDTSCLENSLFDTELYKNNAKKNERSILLQFLHRNNWHLQNTASSLGINRTTLWRKMKRCGLSKKDRPL